MLEKNIKKLIIATAVMGTLVPTGIYAARESDEGLKEEAATQEKLTPAQKRERLTPWEREQLDGSLIEAVTLGDKPKAIYLLRNGANVNTSTYDGQVLDPEKDAGASVLMNAILMGDIDMVKLLINHGANVTFIGDRAQSPLALVSIENLNKYDDCKSPWAEKKHLTIEQKIEIAKILVWAGATLENSYVYDARCCALYCRNKPDLAEEIPGLIHEVLIAIEETEQLLIEKEVSHVLLDRSFLLVNDIIDLVHDYMHLRKKVAPPKEIDAQAQDATLMGMDSEESFYASALRDAEYRRRNSTEIVPQYDENGYFDEID